MQAQRAAASYPINILLIEDEEADARLMTEAMASGKVKNNVVHLLSGVEALQYLYGDGEHAGAEPPDLIILDLNMPHMDGREFLSRIKDEPSISCIPLVVLTNSSDNADIEQSYRNKANCFITKPLDFDKFVEVVQAIENFWFHVAKRPQIT